MIKENPIYIFGGGTFSHIRGHLSLAAPSFGNTARVLQTMLPGSQLILTKMADSNSSLITNEDLQTTVNAFLGSKWPLTIIMSCAVCDYSGKIDNKPSGKYEPKIHEPKTVVLSKENKIVSSIKAKRPDFFLVTFKTTVDASEKEQIRAASEMMDNNKSDIVFANDLSSRKNLLLVQNKNGTRTVRTDFPTDRYEMLHILADTVKKAHTPNLFTEINQPV